MTDISAFDLRGAAQKLIDDAVAAKGALDAAAMQAALDADVLADAVVLKAKDDELASRAAAIVAYQAELVRLKAEFDAYKASHPDTVPPAGDTTAPSVPTGLTATVVSSSGINLAWAASTDAVGVKDYAIILRGGQIGTSTTPLFSHTGLTPATAYSYTVKARDAAGNVSAASAAVSATTSGTATPPPTGKFDEAACKANAGHKGAVLTTYTGPMTITVANTVIENKQINGMLDIRASGFILRKSKMNYRDAWGVYSENAAGPVTIEDCTFVGAGAGGYSVAPWLGFGTFRRNDVSGSSMGMNLQRVCTVEACWIHDLARQPGDHYDGISMMGSNKDSLIKGNLVETPSGSVTAHVFISGQFAACSNNRIEGNRFLGSASFPIYSETQKYPVSGTVVINNEMSKGDYGDGSFSASYVYSNGNTVVHSGNKNAITGAALD